MDVIAPRNADQAHQLAAKHRTAKAKAERQNGRDRACHVIRHRLPSHPACKRCCLVIVAADLDNIPAGRVQVDHLGPHLFAIALACADAKPVLGNKFNVGIL